MDPRSQSPGSEMAIRPGVAMAAPTNDQHGYVEALVRSEIAARTALALARPRSLDNVRVALLTDAQRPGFAEDAEWSQERWDNSKGRKVAITGPSIRFAEACKRAMTNMATAVYVINETERYRVIRVGVSDLETNEEDHQDVLIQKVVERRRPPKDQDEVIGTRMGSTGEVIYLCEAPESEMLLKTNAQVSRILRNLILRFVPGDLQDEVLHQCRKTRANTDAQDPDAARRKVSDAFAFDCKVPPAELERYLGHPLDRSTPAELDGLRGIYRAIRDGQATWTEIMEERAQEKAPGTDATKGAREAAQAAVKRTQGTGPAKPGKGPEGAAQASTAGTPAPSPGDDTGHGSKPPASGGGLGV